MTLLLFLYFSLLFLYFCTTFSSIGTSTKKVQTFILFLVLVEQKVEVLNWAIVEVIVGRRRPGLNLSCMYSKSSTEFPQRPQKFREDHHIILCGPYTIIPLLVVIYVHTSIVFVMMN